MMRWFVRGVPLALAVVVLTGCAATMSGGEQTSINFIAVHPSLPPDQQAADRAGCYARAEQRAGDALAQGIESGAKTGLLGAGIGAAGGAAGGAIFGRGGTGAAVGAVTGFFSGLLAGVTTQAQRREIMVKRLTAECLAERGYQVRFFH